MPARKIQRTNVPPKGLQYVPEILSITEEEKLLGVLFGLPYHDFVLNGVAAKRKVKRYGYSYEFYTPIVEEAEPFPAWLAELRDRAAASANINPSILEQALVAKYDPGAAIGWHRDAPAFGSPVLGISFGADQVMRFRKTHADFFEHFRQPIARRSLYILGGEARSVWQHSIAPATALRYSITFRTINERYRAKKQPGAAAASA